MTLPVAENKGRFWGEEVDCAAAKQLGLDDNHTVFMMSSEADFVDDLEELVEALDAEGQSLLSPHEVVGKVDEYVHRVKLPGGFMMVGMCPVGAQAPKTYGVVDLKSFGYK